jgi:dTDP-4-amino-4,6-dideoxygalactose transaminase
MVKAKKYYHDVVGCNSRLDAIQAAVLRIKLRELDNYSSRRNKAASFYDAAFVNEKAIKTPFRSILSSHVFHQYTLQLSDDYNRDELVDFLATKSIPAMIYYPVPAHKQKMFVNLPTSSGDLSTTEWLTSRVFSLPMHTELKEEQLNYIVSTIKEFLQK